MPVSEPNHAGAIIIRLDLLPTLVDPGNWEWNAESRAVWMLAGERWQTFRKNWHGVPGGQSASPGFQFLLPLPAVDPSISSSILVRESYVTMFDTVWAQAMRSKGRKGVIITGQPGIGTYLHPHIHYIAKMDRVCRQDVVPLLSPYSAFTAETSRPLLPGRRSAVPLLP